MSLDGDNMPTWDILTSSSATAPNPTVPNLQRPNSHSSVPSKHQRSQTEKMVANGGTGRRKSVKHAKENNEPSATSATDPRSAPATTSTVDNNYSLPNTLRNPPQKKRTESAPNAKQRQLPSDYIFKAESMQSVKSQPANGYRSKPTV